jgi:hypothetical protein
VFDDTSFSFFLEIANPLLLEEGKRNAPRITFPIRFPDKYFDEIIRVVMPDIERI